MTKPTTDPFRRLLPQTVIYIEAILSCIEKKSVSPLWEKVIDADRGSFYNVIVSLAQRGSTCPPDYYHYDDWAKQLRSTIRLKAREIIADKVYSDEKTLYIDLMNACCIGVISSQLTQAAASLIEKESVLNNTTGGMVD